MRPTTKKICLIAAAACLALPILAFAAPTTYDAGSTGLTASAGAAGIDTSRDVATIIGTVIKAALGLVGMIFLALMIYAGAYWMIARGDEAKVDKAKETIIAAIIGLVIVVGAYAITYFVVNAFNPQQGGQCTPACTGTQVCQNGACVAPAP